MDGKYDIRTLAIPEKRKKLADGRFLTVRLLRGNRVQVTVTHAKDAERVDEYGDLRDTDE